MRSNLPSNIAQTSYPSGPSKKNPPRRSIVGGYVIDNVTCVAWGSRILEEPLNPEVESDSLGSLALIMRKLRKKPYHTLFIMFGPESFEQYSQPHLMDEGNGSRIDTQVRKGPTGGYC